MLFLTNVTFLGHFLVFGLITFLTVVCFVSAIVIPSSEPTVAWKCPFRSSPVAMIRQSLLYSSFIRTPGRANSEKYRYASQCWKNVFRHLNEALFFHKWECTAGFCKRIKVSIDVCWCSCVLTSNVLFSVLINSLSAMLLLSTHMFTCVCLYTGRGSFYWHLCAHVR